MSIRKLVGKVVGGAAVVALVVAGAVMSAGAQSSLAHPYFANNEPNAADDVKRGTAELPIQFSVDLRAVLLAIPGDLDAGESTVGLNTITETGLTLSTDPTFQMANVGWLFVETNYHMWDILVRRDNGGFLVRDAKDGETPINVGGVTDPNCVTTNDGPFGSPVTTCGEPIIVGGTMGIPLKYVDGGTNTTGPCPLQFAVGVIKNSVLTTPATIMQQIKVPTNIDLLTELYFGVPEIPGVLPTDPPIRPARDEDYASFAFSISEMGSTLPATPSYFMDGASTPAPQNWEDVPSLTTSTDKYFPMIDNGSAIQLDKEINEPYSPVPNPRDQSMVFFINARLNFDETAGDKLIGNRNGTYTENLVFTFYGLY